MTAFDADVAIVGYGPSGVAAANNLGKFGVSSIAFERDTDLYQRARAVTVSDWTMRCFQNIGLDEVVKKDMDETVGLQWKLYDGTKIYGLDFSASPFGHATSYAIYQPLMEQSLRDGVERYPEVQVRYGHEVTSVEQDDDGATITATDLATGATTTTRVKYVLACDGGSSKTRASLGVQMIGDTLGVRWVVVDARVKQWWPDRHILTFWSDAKRPVVDIALGRGNHRWEIPLNPGEKDEDFATSEQVWPLLEDLGVSRDDIEIHQHAFYNHHIRYADRWRVGRVFLLGDAGHLMPPWAGAGMQSGIRDAFNITWKLREVLAGRLPEAVLDTYEAERRPNVEFYTNVAIGLGRIIKQELSPEEMAALTPPPGVEPPPPPLLNAPTVVAGWLRGETGEGSVIGQMIPQPHVITTRGVQTLLDNVLGDGFVLLGDDVDPASVLSTEQKAAWDTLGARYVAVRNPSQHTQGTDEIVDLSGTLQEWLRGFGARVVAIRPDRFVAAADTHDLSVPA